MAAESQSPPDNAIDYEIAAFREVTRHPKAHAHILQQYRVGEYAGVVALKRLLGEMQPEGNLHRAMEIHFRDEERHSKVFPDWIYRLGVTPEEAVMIGDNPTTDGAGAAAMGIPFILVGRRREALARDIAGLLWERAA